MDYIVSFPSGASGRFINNIVTSLLYDLTTIMTYHTHNSVHNWSHESANSYTVGDVDDLLDSNVYKTLEFTGNLPHRLFWTHAFPDFAVIQTKLPDVKVIVITFMDSDVDEISNNSKYKNMLLYPPLLDYAFKHENVIVPSSTLVIPYRDIFTTDMLSTLSKFVGIEPNETTRQNFQKYVNGQRQFLIDIKYI